MAWHGPPPHMRHVPPCHRCSRPRQDVHHPHRCAALLLLRRAAGDWQAGLGVSLCGGARGRGGRRRWRTEHAVACYSLPCHAPCHAMQRQAMPCHAMPCHAKPCDALATPCQPMAQHASSHPCPPHPGRRRYSRALELLLTAIAAPTMVLNAITVGRWLCNAHGIWLRCLTSAQFFAHCRLPACLPACNLTAHTWLVVCCCFCSAGGLPQEVHAGQPAAVGRGAAPAQTHGGAGDVRAGAWRGRGMGKCTVACANRGCGRIQGRRCRLLMTSQHRAHAPMPALAPVSLPA